MVWKYQPKSGRKFHFLVADFHKKWKEELATFEQDFAFCPPPPSPKNIEERVTVQINTKSRGMRFSSSLKNKREPVCSRKKDGSDGFFFLFPWGESVNNLMWSGTLLIGFTVERIGKKVEKVLQSHKDEKREKILAPPRSFDGSSAMFIFYEKPLVWLAPPLTQA